MADLRKSLPAKVAALFLSVILAALCVLSVLGICHCWESGYYERDNMTFMDTDDFRSLTWSLANDALNCYLWDADPASYALLSDGVGFTIAAADDPDTILYSTRLPQAAIWRGTHPIYAEAYDYVSDIPEDTLSKLGRDYLITLCLDHVPTAGGFPVMEQLFQFLYSLRFTLCVLAPLSLLLVLILLVFLCCAAGHRKDTEGITFNWQDRIPLDLYLAIDLSASILSIMLIDTGSSYFRLVLLALSVTLITILALALLMTLATRLKKGGWWRNTLIYLIGSAILRLFGRMFRAVRDIARTLPYTWRTALFVLVVLSLQFFLSLLIWNDYHMNGFWLVLLLVFDLLLFLAAILFSWQMKLLFREGEALASGDLEAKVDTRWMFRALETHGGHLNAIGDGMNAAVEQRMRSEHFKTELITNVSHDLKTPLTSIINYVDLLKKEDIGNPTARQYIEVLDRKSQRLKKLTEDLVEASKASTGALTVVRERIDLNQLLEQAVAEYEDRMLQLDLHPMLLLPTPPVCVMADGRHLWRVIDNLLSNCCKYTMPGTRVYVEAARSDGKAVLSVKNISRDPLNISADALMERFVRGDASRTTEGSGLGLSIARSLTELQDGEFDISIDGDLFKATITFTEYNV